MRLTITGTPDLSPDCTIEDTGEPVHLSLWTWTLGEPPTTQVWWLGFNIVFNKWLIADDNSAPLDYAWQSDTLLGDYTPLLGFSSAGTVTVAEYVPPPEKFLVLEILSGPNAGKYTVLKESV